MIRIDGIQPPVDLRGYRHGAAGSREVEDFGAVHVACCCCAVGASAVGVLAHDGAARVIFCVEGLLCDWRCGAEPCIGFEEALACAVVLVADGGWGDVNSKYATRALDALASGL